MIQVNDFSLSDKKKPKTKQQIKAEIKAFSSDGDNCWYQGETERFKGLICFMPANRQELFTEQY